MASGERVVLLMIGPAPSKTFSLSFFVAWLDVAVPTGAWGAGALVGKVPESLCNSWLQLRTSYIKLWVGVCWLSLYSKNLKRKEDNES